MYKSLNDAGARVPALQSGPAEIWYQKRLGTIPQEIDFSDLTKTHIKLGYCKCVALDEIFSSMQGEIWSPEGEARDLISSLDLHHTSMSVGDIIVIDDVTFLVGPIGFLIYDKNGIFLGRVS